MNKTSQENKTEIFLDSTDHLTVTFFKIVFIANESPILTLLSYANYTENLIDCHLFICLFLLLTVSKFESDNCFLFIVNNNFNVFSY